jgi:hypothetical protein
MARATRSTAAPPSLPQARGGPLTVLPMLAVVVMLGVGALAWSSGSVSHAPTTLMFPAMMLVSAVGMLAQSAVRRGAAELDDHRRRYLDHLGALADQLTDALRGSMIRWSGRTPNRRPCGPWPTGQGCSNAHPTTPTSAMFGSGWAQRLGRRSRCRPRRRPTASIR